MAINKDINLEWSSPIMFHPSIYEFCLCYFNGQKIFSNFSFIKSILPKMNAIIGNLWFLACTMDMWWVFFSKNGPNKLEYLIGVFPVEQANLKKRLPQFFSYFQHNFCNYSRTHKLQLPSHFWHIIFQI